MRSRPLLDNDVVSWVVEEALVKRTCPKMKELKTGLDRVKKALYTFEKNQPLFRKLSSNS